MGTNASTQTKRAERDASTGTRESSFRFFPSCESSGAKRALRTPGPPQSASTQSPESSARTPSTETPP